MDPAVVTNLPHAAIEVDRDLALRLGAFRLALYDGFLPKTLFPFCARWARRRAARVGRVRRPGVGATRLFHDRTQARQVRLGRRAPLIDRKIDRTVAEAFQRLTQAADSALALTAHAIEIDLDRHELRSGARFVKHVSRRSGGE